MQNFYLSNKTMINELTSKRLFAQRKRTKRLISAKFRDCVFMCLLFYMIVEKFQQHRLHLNNTDSRSYSVIIYKFAVCISISHAICSISHNLCVYNLLSLHNLILSTDSKREEYKIKSHHTMINVWCVMNVNGYATK